MQTAWQGNDSCNHKQQQQPTKKLGKELGSVTGQQQLHLLKSSLYENFSEIHIEHTQRSSKAWQSIIHHQFPLKQHIHHESSIRKSEHQLCS